MWMINKLVEENKSLRLENRKLREENGKTQVKIVYSNDEWIDNGHPSKDWNKVYDMQMMNKFLNRAKYIDEPFVRHRLEQLYPNSRFSLGDVESDWEHADIEMTTQTGVSYKIDVKRPLPKYLNSPNFTFIFYKNEKFYL